MSIISFETRQLSFEDIKPERKKRYNEILTSLMTGAKTAKEIAVEMYEFKIIPSSERNFTAPRLTELEKMGLVRVIDKKKCQYTGKRVAIYEITTNGIEERYSNHIPRID